MPLEIILKIISIPEAKSQAENGMGPTTKSIWTAIQTLFNMNFMNSPAVQSRIFQMDNTFHRESGENCNLDFCFARGWDQGNTWLAHLLSQKFGLPIQKTYPLKTPFFFFF